MPSWDNAASRHVEEEEMEMEKLDHNQAQQQSLLSQQDSSRYYNNQPEHAGDLGAMHAQPYHDYSQHQQYAPSIALTAQQSAYPPTYHSGPDRNAYAPTGQQYRGYEPSVAPSYHTTAQGIVSPLSPPPPQGNGMGRKPVQGTWRDV
ncbi:hypothetical protein LTR78_008590 [Recurvomyces mirabilis]|uniref:Uncharacterized protein n=1 Tax=Recurvomyces mirabilis TaxID=574656 RepID=A0AAE0WIR2_9PEZI|nr:hypothetical protein LTR78_008590 [Recurvomyces mirabilis]KAK5153498.1 hypothetical protein LTS14_007669 [Recurvomyces mirabilis]